jgi:S-adenosylhomocysteine hydrolase
MGCVVYVTEIDPICALQELSEFLFYIFFSTALTTYLYLLFNESNYIYCNMKLANVQACMDGFPVVKLSEVIRQVRVTTIIDLKKDIY